MGPMTPTKIASLGLCFAGIAVLIGGRIIESWSGGFGVGVALLLIGLSFLVDALLPGGSELSDEQIAMLKHMSIPYRPGAERILSIAIGVVLLPIGIYLTVW